MQIPEPIHHPIRAAMRDHFGHDPGELVATPVGGGCISPAARVEGAAGDVVFLKWGGAPQLFEAESHSLEVLHDAGVVRVPEVIAVGRAEAGFSWILLEWLEPGRATPALWTRLGTGLATLHRTRAERYGWPADNFIGTLPQENGWLDDWGEFWRVRRLEPQLRLAYDAGWFDPPVRRRFDTLLDELGELLGPAAADGPSLLHGDLWSGNLHPMAGDEPALIDPASYYGHREVDLAMTELFGGFGPEFYHGYHEAWPLVEGYDGSRRAIYQLYYLLVHVNIFGIAYLERTITTLATLAHVRCTRHLRR